MDAAVPRHSAVLRHTGDSYFPYSFPEAQPQEKGRRVRTVRQSLTALCGGRAAVIAALT
jgi:hypothetical protein